MRKTATLTQDEINPHKAGTKMDAGKGLADLVIGDFARALSEVVKVGTFGANKYTESGWLAVPDARKRYANAAMRHYLERQSGMELDPESGLFHKAHECWNHLAELELMLREIEG